jgi:hypothetical protein
MKNRKIEQAKIGGVDNVKKETKQKIRSNTSRK